jgi:hypothetical protein
VEHKRLLAATGCSADITGTLALANTGLNMDEQDARDNSQPVFIPFIHVKNAFASS